MTKEEYLNPQQLDRVMLQIETTNICNHSCEFCPNPKITAKRSFIDRELAMRVTREAYEMGVRTVAFFMFGEPLLCPDILDYYRYAAELGYTERVLVTNLALADEKMIRDLFDAGVNAIKVSINGGSRSYAKVHGRDDYERVMSLLKYAYEYKTANQIPCTILSSYVVTKDNADEFEEHAARLKGITDFVLPVGLLDFAGSVAREKDELNAQLAGSRHMLDISPGCPCRQLSRWMIVTVDGYLSLCCHEPYGRARVCDLRTMPLRDAWYSDTMQELRKRHLDRDLDGLLCYNCINHTDKPAESFLEKSDAVMSK